MNKCISLKNLSVITMLVNKKFEIAQRCVLKLKYLT